MESWIFFLQSIYCKHLNNYIITVQHSPLLVQCTYTSAWQARRFRGKSILSDGCAATHVPPTEPRRRLRTAFHSAHPDATSLTDVPVFPYHVLDGCWTSVRRILHTSDAVLELLSPFIHLCTTRTPVTVLNSHPTMNLYRFHSFAEQKSHNTLLLLLSALLQGRCRLVKLFPRVLCVPQACQRHLLVAQGHHLRRPYTRYQSYTRFLIQLFQFPTELPLYNSKNELCLHWSSVIFSFSWFRRFWKLMPMSKICRW